MQKRQAELLQVEFEGSCSCLLILVKPQTNQSRVERVSDRPD
jgi:hypothetical protein